MLKRRLLAGLLASASLCTLSAAEIFSAKSMADFQKTPAVSVKGDTFTAKGNVQLYGKKVFKVDPAKKYRISAVFKCVSGKTGIIYLGFKPLDANGKQIHPRYVCNNIDSFTELAAPAQKGDKVIKLKNAAKWQDNTFYSNVAFDAKADFSDLPNSNVIHTVKKAIVKKGDLWEVTLRAPLPKAYPAGTKVRQQLDSGNYIYVRTLRGLTDKETKISEIISGHYKDRIGPRKFWPGTRSFSVVLLHLGTRKDTVIEFKDFKVEEL